MLPNELAARLVDMRRVLERCCPAVASIRLRLGLQSLSTLVARDARVGRAVRLASHACLHYGQCRFGDRDLPKRDIAKLLDRLENSLLGARPSAAATRLGREW